jgi:hypothetical protein
MHLCSERFSVFNKSDTIGLVNRENIFPLSFPRAEADSPVWYFCPFPLHRAGGGQGGIKLINKGLSPPLQGGCLLADGQGGTRRSDCPAEGITLGDVACLPPFA